MDERMDPKEKGSLKLAKKYSNGLEADKPAGSKKE